MATTTPTALEAWARDFADQALTEQTTDAFVRMVDAGIAAHIPEIAADPMLMEDLHGSTRAQWRTFANGLVGEHRFVLPAAAADLVRSLARRGLDLGLMLKIYRVAHPGVFQFLSDTTDAIDETGPPRDEALKFIWTRAEQWMDDSVESLIETYYDERQHQVEGTLRRRSMLVEELLRGGAADVDGMSKKLSHALGHWQTAGVTWVTSGDSAEAADVLRDVADRCARALGAPRPLIVLAGSRDLWFWVATPKEPDLTALAELGQELGDLSTHVAIGIPATGVGGFRSGHAEARAAQRVSLGAVRPPALMQYADVELLSMATENDEMIKRLVLREIPGLCGAEKNLAQVRETLLAYLSYGLNVEATAEQLFVHKNTVRYRLSRAEELLGHPLAERAAKVELALRYVALYGPPAATGSAHS